MTNERMQELIKKYRIEIALRDGVEMIKTASKLSTVEVDEIKSNKPAILAELHRLADEKAAAWAVKRAALEVENELGKIEYLRTADLRRCLVCYQDEYGHIEWYIETLMFTEGHRAFRTEYGLSNRVNLAHVTPTVDALNSDAEDWTAYGLGGVVVEITPEQEAQMVAEQAPAAIVATAIAAEKKTAADAAKKAQDDTAAVDLAAKFKEAFETNKPVVLRSWITDCCDPREECSTDVRTEYALPDGSTKITSHHTW